MGGQTAGMLPRFRRVHVRAQDGADAQGCETAWTPYCDRDNRKVMASKVVIGQRVRGLREKAGLSQQALADHLSWDQPHLARIERGRVEPSLKSLRKLADFFGIDLGALVTDGEG
jgi:ribosome-binding protein aMBF1 (putative translation factor)